MPTDPKLHAQLAEVFENHTVRGDGTHGLVCECGDWSGGSFQERRSHLIDVLLLRLAVEVEARAQAMTSRQAALREFAEWITSLDDDDPQSPGRIDRQTVTLTRIIGRARAALED